MKKEDKKFTIGDRLASAGVMALASFLTGLFLWGFSLLITMAGSFDNFLPFLYVWYFVATFTILAFFFPTLALNTIGRLWKVLANEFKKANDNPWF